MSKPNNLPRCQQKLTEADVDPRFKEVFAYYYQQFLDDETGEIPESTIEPVESLPDAEKLTETTRSLGLEARSRTVMIKLNGGLGTGMGLRGPKSLLPVRENKSFLEIIARQAEHDEIPLLLMNSEVTEYESMNALREFEPSLKNLPSSFLQHQQPKIRQDDGTPVTCEANPRLEWCPPGHGDIYLALVTSRALEQLRADGKRYAFVSNADNLGAVFDPSILGYMVENGCDFLMEVADRTEMDKKGGHLASRDGKLILRESAQCPTGDTSEFQDITRHRYFNTNNLWIDLDSLEKKMAETNNNLKLPMILNSKNVDPRDPSSTPVFQLETAMGSAIEVFDDAGAIRIPRRRFAPVKGTNDLLLVRSDAYEMLKPEFRVIMSRDRRIKNTTVRLDPRYYSLIHDFDARFPLGASLRDCSSLNIEGDFTFDGRVVFEGDVNLKPPPLLVTDDLTISGEVVPRRLVFEFTEG